MVFERLRASIHHFLQAQGVLPRDEAPVRHAPPPQTAPSHLSTDDFLRANPLPALDNLSLDAGSPQRSVVASSFRDFFIQRDRWQSERDESQIRDRLQVLSREVDLCLSSNLPNAARANVERVLEMEAVLSNPHVSDALKVEVREALQRAHVQNELLRGNFDDAKRFAEALPASASNDALRNSVNEIRQQRVQSFVFSALSAYGEVEAQLRTRNGSRRAAQAWRQNYNRRLQSEMQAVNTGQKTFAAALQNLRQQEEFVRRICNEEAPLVRLLNAVLSGTATQARTVDLSLAVLVNFTDDQHFAAAMEFSQIFRGDYFGAGRALDAMDFVPASAQQASVLQNFFNVLNVISVGILPTAESSEALANTGAHMASFALSAGFANTVARGAVLGAEGLGYTGYALQGIEFGTHTAVMGATVPLLTPREERLTLSRYWSEFQGMWGLAAVLRGQGMLLGELDASLVQHLNTLDRITLADRALVLGLRSSPFQYTTTIGTMTAYDAATHPELGNMPFGLQVLNSITQDLQMRGGEIGFNNARRAARVANGTVEGAQALSRLASGGMDRLAQAWLSFSPDTRATVLATAGVLLYLFANRWGVHNSADSPVMMSGLGNLLGLGSHGFWFEAQGDGGTGGGVRSRANRPEMNAFLDANRIEDVEIPSDPTAEVHFGVYDGMSNAEVGRLANLIKNNSASGSALEHLGNRIKISLREILDPNTLNPLLEILGDRNIKIEIESPGSNPVTLERREGRVIIQGLRSADVEMVNLGRLAAVRPVLRIEVQLAPADRNTNTGLAWDIANQALSAGGLVVVKNSSGQTVMEVTPRDIRIHEENVDPAQIQNLLHQSGNWKTAIVCMRGRPVITYNAGTDSRPYAAEINLSGLSREESERVFNLVETLPRELFRQGFPNISGLPENISPELHRSLGRLARRCMEEGAPLIRLEGVFSMIRNPPGSRSDYEFNTLRPLSKVQGVFGAFLSYETSRGLEGRNPSHLTEAELGNFWEAALLHAVTYAENAPAETPNNTTRSEYRAFTDTPGATAPGWSTRWVNALSSFNAYLQASRSNQVQAGQVMRAILDHSQTPGETGLLGFRGAEGRSLQDNAFELMRIFYGHNPAQYLAASNTNPYTPTAPTLISNMIQRVLPLLGQHGRVYLNGAPIGMVYKAYMGGDAAALVEHTRLLDHVNELSTRPGNYRITVIPEDSWCGRNPEIGSFRTPDWVVDNLNDPQGNRQLVVVDIKNADAQFFNNDAGNPTSVNKIISDGIHQITTDPFHAGLSNARGNLIINLYRASQSSTASLTAVALGTIRQIYQSATPARRAVMDRLSITLNFRERENRTRQDVHHGFVTLTAADWGTGPVTVVSLPLQSGIAPVSIAAGF